MLAPRVALAALGGSALLIVYLLKGAADLPALPPFESSRAGELEQASDRDTWPVPASLQSATWDRIRSTAPAEAQPDDSLAGRFRLAGTFFQYTAMGTQLRKAIIDDSAEGVQTIASEGDRIDRVSVERIFRDRVTLRAADGEAIELWMSFAGGPAATSPAGDEESYKPDDPESFGGRRLGENRWMFSRERLLEYYQGLRDQPERLVLLFDSLKPVYTPEGWIEGYQLGVEGERDFFAAVGLREGDIVRSVNNVEMTNRRRAEFFITQLVEADPTAFVLDVEREGELSKFTYQFR